MHRLYMGTVFAALVSVSTPALADESLTDVYAALAVGKSSYHQPGIDDGDPAMALMLGYRVSPSLGVELYARSLSLNIDGPFADAAYYPTGNVGLALAGAVPLVQGVSLIGRAGIGRTTTHSARVANPDRHISEAMLGGAIAWRWTPRWQISAEAVRFTRSNATVASLGLQYAF